MNKKQLLNFWWALRHIGIPLLKYFQRLSMSLVTQNKVNVFNKACQAPSALWLISWFPLLPPIWPHWPLALPPTCQTHSGCFYQLYLLPGLFMPHDHLVKLLISYLFLFCHLLDEAILTSYLRLQPLLYQIGYSQSPSSDFSPQSPNGTDCLLI